MKKAKIMLTTLIFFAAIGCIMAFKARSNDRIYIDSDSDGFSDTFITGIKLTWCLAPDAFATGVTNTLNVATVATCAIHTGN